MRQRWWIWSSLLLGVLLVVAAGCREQDTLATRTGGELAFFADLTVDRNEEVIVDLGLETGSAPVPADEGFNGRWEVTDTAGALRAAADVHEIERLPADAERVILSWSGRLAPGTHELRWGAPGYGGVTVEFDVLEEEGRLSLEVTSETRETVE